MPDRLHALLLALALLDLAFVQSTAAVDPGALAPLWLLAAASPWLRRLQRHAAWRWAWNAGVVLVFVLLVRHAITTGLLHMLEDGLLLAVLCQVHLLNNVGERQRPDLVFFNSFLIAFVASMFSPDFTWSLLFALHTAALVPALMVNVLAHAPLSRAGRRALVAAGCRGTFAVAAATALVFIAWPRDFGRRGWLEQAGVLVGHGAAGAAERIQLGNELPLHRAEEVVLRIAPASGRATDVPRWWRGTCYTVFTGDAWLPQDARWLGSRFATDPPWLAQAGGHWQRGTPAAGGELRVRLADPASRRLYCPLDGAVIRVDPGRGLLLDPRSDGALGFLQCDDTPAGPVDYRIRPGTVPPVPVTRAVRGHLLELPAELPPGLHDLAARLAAAAGPGADAAAIAAADCRWLAEQRRYQLPGRPGFAPSFAAFVAGEGDGHCEYFASTLALLLRRQGVPCRLVGGFLAHEHDPSTGTTVVRARDAHAWVEALREDGSWLTLEATPAFDAGDAHGGGAWWDALAAAAEQAWSAVVGFDAERRERLAAALADLPAAALRAARDRPAVAAAILAMLGLLHYLRRRQRQGPPAIAAFARAARAAGLALRRGETPRDLLARAEAAALSPARLAALRTAARQHEAVRYGSRRGVER